MATSSGPGEGKPAGEKPAPGRYAYDGLERIIHERARLSILASLAANPQGLLFSDLKDLCALTDGNLSRHLQVLQEESLVEIWKGFRKNRPQTLCRLTDAGRRRFLEYINVLENVVADAMTAAKDAAAADAPRKGSRGRSGAAADQDDRDIPPAAGRAATARLT